MFQPDELYVTNIPGNATDEEVQALFAQHGTVREYVVVSKRKEANLAQAALVRMEDHAGALAARKALNRFDLHGKQLNVRWSNTQRVLWVSHLHDSVTNEMLHAAFSQFGNIQKAVVVADAQTLSTKCYGFVVFENKKDAVRAMSKCVEQPFMIGQSSKPVKVEWARLDDTDQGYTEEVRAAGRGGAPQGKDLNPRVISRFAAPGTREYLLAVRVAEIEVEYQQMKQSMHAKMQELQDQVLVTGQAPGLAESLVSDPMFAAIRASGAPAGPPPMGGYVAVPPPGPAPGQLQYGPPPVQYGPPPTQYSVPAKREPEPAFHHVPPPKRSAMRPKDPDFERFNPEASARAHGHPQAPHPGQQPQGQQAPSPQQPSSAQPAHGAVPPPAAPYGAPPPASGLSFVKGGQLHTTETHAGGPKPPPGNPQDHAHLGQAAGQPEGEGAALLPAPPGAKPPGHADHRGIGFSGPVPTPAPQPLRAHEPHPGAVQYATAPQYGAPPQAAQGQYTYAPPGQPQYGAPPAGAPLPTQYTYPPPQQYAPPPQSAAPPPTQYTYPPQQQAAPPPQQQQQQYAMQPQVQYAPQQAPGQPQAYAANTQPSPAQYGPPPSYAAAPPPSGYAPQQSPGSGAAPPPAAGPPAMSGYGGGQAYAVQYAPPPTWQ